MLNSATPIKNICLLLNVVLGVCTALHGQEPKRYALLIAVTTYDNSEMNKPQLEYPVIDAKAVGEFLEKHGYTVEYLLGSKATKSAIEKKLESLSNKSNQSGAAIIGMWGHGVEFAGSKEAMFCPFDTSIRLAVDSKGKPLFGDDGKRMVEPNPNSLVGMSKILDGLKICGAGNRLLIADCCRTSPNRPRGRAFGSNVTVSDLPDNTAAIFACGANEVAFEHESWGHGAMTKGLLDQLEAMARRDVTEVTSLLGPLKRDVAKMVKQISNGHDEQTIAPILKGLPDLKLVLKSVVPRLFDALKGASKAEAVSSQREWAKHLGTEVQIENDIGMKFVLIPPGEFMMGRTDNGKGRRHNNAPRHRVKISQPYFLGQHEVTQKQWRDVMGTEPWLDEAGDNEFGVKTGDDYPATHVSWEDAIKFCKKLSDRDGVDYRLPTEAEWEYACRAGTSTKYSFGDSEAELSKYAWYGENAYKIDEKYPHRVGQKRSNPFGLHDIHGNVSEWCSDWYGKDYYSNSPLTDPPGPKTGTILVSRGGSWQGSAGGCLSVTRVKRNPHSRLKDLGFRVLRSSVPAGQ